LGKHRKLSPTGGERLMWAMGGGETLVSFDTYIGKLGGLICWENFMPLARNVMYQAGVQVYVAPTWDSSENWQIAMRYIAREGGMFVIGCAQGMKMSDVPDKYEFKKFYPEDREWINKGNSLIVGPDGKVLAGPLEAEQSIIYADVNLNDIPAQKWLYDVAGHYSRPDVFEFGIK
jgi:nitrilase